MKLSEVACNARLDGLAQLLGAGAKLQIRTGEVPPVTVAPDVGQVLVTFPLAQAAKAKGGRLDLVATPVRATATGDGDAGHYRVYVGSVCHLQGSLVGEGADLTLTDMKIGRGQIVDVKAWAILEDAF